MEILEKQGIPTPRGKAATTAEQAYKIAESFSKNATIIEHKADVVLRDG